MANKNNLNIIYAYFYRPVCVACSLYEAPRNISFQEFSSGITRLGIDWQAADSARYPHTHISPFLFLSLCLSLYVITVIYLYVIT